MEAAVDSYASCLGAETDRATAKLHQQKPTGLPSFQTVRSACASTRAHSLATADDALKANPLFADQKVRKAFIAQRFESLDQMMAETFDGGMDPGKWK